MTAQVLVKLSAKLAADQQADKLEHNELSKLRFESDDDISDQEGAILNPPDTDGISHGTFPTPEEPENYQTVKYNRTHGSKMK